jgi:hypothetical protein
MNVQKLEQLIKGWTEPSDEVILEIDGVEFEIAGFEVNEYYGQVILKGIEVDYGDEPGPDDDAPDLDGEESCADICALPEHTPTVDKPKVTEA